MAVKILHTSDLHLLRERDERWQAFEYILDLAEKEEVDLLVISGDLFDRSSASQRLRPALRQLLSDTSFYTVIIEGNHDQGALREGFYFGDRVVVLTNLQRPFAYRDVRLFGSSFSSSSPEAFLESLYRCAHLFTPDKINILLLHCELLDMVPSLREFGDEGDSRYLPVKLRFFKGLNINYVLAGHFHTNFLSEEFERGSWFVYPGSPVSITKRETGPRAVNIFVAGEKPEKRTIPTPYYHPIHITLDPSQRKDPIDEIKEELSRLPSYARLLLTVDGYFNSEKLGLSEKELAERIKAALDSRVDSQDLRLEFRDVKHVFDSELFQRFLEKARHKGYSNDELERMKALMIKAMSGMKE